MRDKSAYYGVFDRGFGKECICIPLFYDFYSSGVLIQSTIEANIEAMRLIEYKPEYLKVKLICCMDQSEASKVFNTTQQTISRWIKNHNKVMRKIRSGELLYSTQKGS